MSKDKLIIQKLLDSAEVTINGNKDYDIQVHNDAFYGRVLQQGTLGLGESYMEGWWDCEHLDQFFHKVMLADLEKQIKGDWDVMIKIASKLIFSAGHKSRSFEIGKKHYDIGNDLYKIMLDKRLSYTCGYWQNAKNLDAAQDAKLDLVCRKIGLQKGQKVLDIGCGWGSFVGYAAQNYSADAIGITVSKEQKKLADELYKNLHVKIKLQDYRDINEKFDHIVSIGMFEHVGHQHHRTYMKVAHQALNEDGLFLLHTIGGNLTSNSIEPWINKYIFPGGDIPSITQISTAIEGLFVIEDLHNFGTNYDKTLMAWCQNFEKGWDQLSSNYTEQFHRMWRYYLLSCAGAFRARKMQLWQIVLSKNGVPGGYKSVR